MRRIIKSTKQNYKLNPYIDEAVEMILPICKCLQSIMPVTNIVTEKQHEISEAYHKVNEAKIWLGFIHG